MKLSQGRFNLDVMKRLFIERSAGYWNRGFWGGPVQRQELDSIFVGPFVLGIFCDSRIQRSSRLEPLLAQPSCSVLTQTVSKAAGEMSGRQKHQDRDEGRERC